MSRYIVLLAVTIFACVGELGDPGPGSRPGDPGPSGLDPGGTSPASGDSGHQGDAVTPDDQCSTLKSAFQSTSWPVLEANCLSCHQDAGVSSPLEFVDGSAAGADDINFGRFKTIGAKKDAQGISIILAKAANTNSDHGGRMVLSPSSSEYAELSKLLVGLAGCIDEPADRRLGIVPLTPYRYLRKVTLALAGRLPTTAEEELVSGATAEQEFDSALDSIMDGLLAEEQFYQRLREIYNDLLLTNAFPNFQAISRFDLRNFRNEFYFGREVLDGKGYSIANRSRIRRNVNYGLERSPLELVVNVVRKNRPFTEILTANYVMVNPYTARLFDAAVPGGFEFTYDEPIASNDPGSFVEAVITDKNGRTLPHAGVLTDLAFLTRYPSTATNRQRARARYVYKYFLDTEVEGLADRAGLDLDNIRGPFPTFNDPQCTQCHTVVDPVASLFKNWDNRGKYRGNFRKWFDTRKPQQMLSPGFSDQRDDRLPATRSGGALQWLAERIVADNRFAVSTVKTIFVGLTGRPPAASETNQIEELKRGFVDSNFDLKALIKATVSSTGFAAANLGGAEDPALYSDVGTGRLLIPEQLDRKLQAVTGGYRWRSPSGKPLTDMDTFLTLYGGINSIDNIKRTTDPSVVVKNIQERIAFQTSCETIPQEFDLPAVDRVLLPLVSLTDTPDTSAGRARVKRNIQYLHKRVLGEERAVGDPEISRTYELFSAAWTSAKTTGGGLQGACRSGRSAAVRSDATFTVRSWMAVLAYLLNDYEFLYE